MFQFIFSKLNNISFFPYYIITPCIYAIGTASEQILDAHLKTSKKILIIKLSLFSTLLEYKVCNHALFSNIYEENLKLNYLDKFIRFFVRVLIEFEFIIQRFFLLKVKKFFKCKLAEEMGFPTVGISSLYSNTKITFNNFHNHEYREIKKLDKKKINIKIEISKNKYEFFNKKFFSKLKKKYVCIHVRDQLYRKDSHRRNFRNSNINNYIKTIKFLISRGYSVVRLGNYNSCKINFKNKNFFDYTKFKCSGELLDLILIKNCFFFIATHSGVYDTARLFRKPILLTNMTVLFSGYLLDFKSRGIFKKIFFENKKINIKDYTKLPFYEYLSEEQLKNKLEYIDNTSEEIKNATKEFLNLMETNNFRLNKKQNKINSYLKKRLRYIYNTQIKKINQFKSNLSQRQSLRMIRYFKATKGCFANCYLGNK